eukprot:TRINITY_DN40_c1_g1_i1.p1 TRINITY_DN40_c1_g1~~TRINITY_DN40_c1_g1_i1.p1  ORF type:complete len:411 (-),score=81.73 TRINITY_DN40_c1_g1_i1:30-1262(-)
MALARPTVAVYGPNGKRTEAHITLPAVFTAPLRHDIVRFVHTNIGKNHRQPQGVARRAGHQTSAESWGTGRAVSRIPRVSGGGTHRSGQGAFGNMCRGGRMFAPLKIFRRWHRIVNKDLRRYAVASAVAASALPSLVLGRGHRISKVPELPLVADNQIQSISKTKDGLAWLKALGADEDTTRAKDSKSIRAGRGKWRNRRYTLAKGPLVIFDKKDSGHLAFRNLPGVDFGLVSQLNLLKLAPGGHFGRFVLWSEGAFRALNQYFGNGTKPASKRHYTLPAPILSNTDVFRVLASAEIKSALRNRRVSRRPNTNLNPLTNAHALRKLNPVKAGIELGAKRNARRKALGLAPKKSKKERKGSRKGSAKAAAKPQAKKAEEPKKAAESPKVEPKKAEAPPAAKAPAKAAAKKK